MASIDVANHMINHIIKQGKNILHNQYINKEKVPAFANTQSNSDYQQIILHAGFKAEQNKRFGYFRMKKDQIPHQVQKDRIMVKSNKIIQKKTSKKQINIQSKKNPKLNLSRTKSNKSAKSLGINTLMKFQKQNDRLVKLENPSQQSQLTTRVKNKLLQAQNQMRQKHKQLKQRKDKQAQEDKLFQQTKNNSQTAKKQLLEQHLSKGQDFKYNFDNDGNVILFRHTNQVNPIQKTKIYPKPTNYSILKDENDQEVGLQQKNRSRFKSYHRKNINDRPSSNDNQRIKSAKGLGFASTVLKTMNLSRISLNMTYQEFEPEHFMARNDLFNNNHSRQTTNIPYFQPKSGTVYTQVSTNQVVDSKPQSRAKSQVNLQKAQSTIDKASKNFKNFMKNGQNINCKTSREQSAHENEQRTIKTDNNRRKTPLTQRRPYSSIVNKGRIITGSSVLMMDLLQ